MLLDKEGRSTVNIHESAKDFPDAKKVRFWDLASTVKERAKDDPDYTVGSLVAVTLKDGLNVLWIYHIVAIQEEKPKRDRVILKTTEKDGPEVLVAVESVAGYKDAYTDLKATLMGVRSVKKVTPIGDKVVRASPMEPVFEAGNVHIVRAPWNAIFFEQFGAFPSTACHDDVVDSVGGGYNLRAKKPVISFNRRQLGM